MGCAVSPDGRQVISASKDHTLKVWDLEKALALRSSTLATATVTATLTGHDEVSGCAVSPDGRRVVSASWDNTLRVWDLETGAVTAFLCGHRSTVLGCAVSPNGRRVISASYDQTLKVWDLETGTETATLTGHTGPVSGCAVSPDGRQVISASHDQTLKVWDLETGTETATLTGHTGPVHGCAAANRALPKAAAWRPDPTSRHQLRYWDGQDWTAYVADQGTQSTDPVKTP